MALLLGCGEPWVCVDTVPPGRDTRDSVKRLVNLNGGARFESSGPDPDATRF